jgi:hypothetical protein
MKLDLLTNATVVDDAIRFVSRNPKTQRGIAMKMRNNLTMMKTKIS